MKTKIQIMTHALRDLFSHHSKNVNTPKSVIVGRRGSTQCVYNLECDARKNFISGNEKSSLNDDVSEV